MNISLTALVAFLALGLGVYVLLTRNSSGGGGGGSDRAFPSFRPTTNPGGAVGYVPGTTKRGYRNGGVGATQPEVWAN